MRTYVHFELILLVNMDCRANPFIIICSHICGQPVTMTYDYPPRHVLHPLNKLIGHGYCFENHPPNE